VPAASLLLVLPSAVNLAGGLTWIWTPSLPLPLLHLLTRAGLLDGWLVLDLLAASGVLGGAALAALAARERTAAVLLIAAVSAISLAAAVVGGAWLPTWYGAAYGGALVILRRLPAVMGERFTGRTWDDPGRPEGPESAP
jgi:hypothetical protein